MNLHRKKLVSVILVMSLILTMIPTIASAQNESEQQIVSDELLKIMDVTYEELLSGDYEDFGDTYSCIIWIKDIDMEQAVRAGIDAAEMTKETYVKSKKYDYPYEVMNVNGQKVVEVNLSDDASDTYVQTYINAERATAAELYIDQNMKFVADTFQSRTASVSYVSAYSPCVFADLGMDEIAKLLEKEEVQRIGYWDEEGGSDEAGASDSFTQEELSDLATHLNIIRAGEAKSVYGVSGSGVKIGQIETGCTVETSVSKQSGYSITDHANWVYTIMSSVAPGASYFGSAAGSAGANFKGGIEWLISQGVNIINCSYGLGNHNAYGELARWVDHITYNHDVHFVKSAGNNGTDGVTSPGMAYNIITVGNTNMSDTYAIHSDSSYNNYGVTRAFNRTFKPDLCAPGTYDNSTRDLHGTSLATPLVTGTIALMCELEPALKTKQHIVKAILAATTLKNTRKYVTTDANFEMYGAGMIDARSALWAVSQGHYSTSTGTVSSSSTTKTYSMTVTSGDTLMRVALAYANRLKFDASSGHENLTGLSGTIGELKLEVYSPGGSLVASCTTAGANLKVVEFDPRPYGTGAYTIRITQTVSASEGRSTNFGVAWR